MNKDVQRKKKKIKDMQRDREAGREEERKRKRRIFNEKLLAEAKKSS